MLLEFVFALDEEEELDDGTIAEITLIFEKEEMTRNVPPSTSRTRLQ